jgi:hypothetical protein
MKKLLLFLFILFAADLFGQDTLTIFLPADRLVSEVLTPKKIYKYPDFIPGKIFFRDGNFSEGKFNYNYLNGEMEFIQKDTLAIAKQQMLNIKMMTVDKDTFFYDKGYLQQVVQTPLGRLLKKQMLVVKKREKIGAYEQPSSTSAIESYGSFTDNFGNFTPGLKVRENITLVLRSDYYFGDKFNVFLLANKKNVLKTYPNKKNSINQYLQKNKVNFKNGDDLRKLLASLQ